VTLYNEDEVWFTV